MISRILKLPRKVLNQVWPTERILELGYGALPLWCHLWRHLNRQFHLNMVGPLSPFLTKKVIFWLNSYLGVWNLPHKFHLYLIFSFRQTFLFWKCPWLIKNPCWILPLGLDSPSSSFILVFCTSKVFHWKMPITNKDCRVWEIEIGLMTLNGAIFVGTITPQEAKSTITLGFPDFTNFDGVRFALKGVPIIVFNLIFKERQ